MHIRHFHHSSPATRRPPLVALILRVGLVTHRSRTFVTSSPCLRNADVCRFDSLRPTIGSWSDRQGETAEVFIIKYKSMDRSIDKSTDKITDKSMSKRDNTTKDIRQRAEIFLTQVGGSQSDNPGLSHVCSVRACMSYHTCRLYLLIFPPASWAAAIWLDGSYPLTSFLRYPSQSSHTASRLRRRARYSVLRNPYLSFLLHRPRMLYFLFPTLLSLYHLITVTVSVFLEKS